MIYMCAMEEWPSLVLLRTCNCKLTAIHYSQKHGGTVSSIYSNTPYILGKYLFSETTGRHHSNLSFLQSTPIKNQARACIGNMRTRKGRLFLTRNGLKFVYKPGSFRPTTTTGVVVRSMEQKSELPNQPTIASSFN